MSAAQDQRKLAVLFECVLKNEKRARSGSKLVAIALPVTRPIIDSDVFTD